MGAAKILSCGRRIGPAADATQRCNCRLMFTLGRQLRSNSINLFYCRVRQATEILGVLVPLPVSAISASSVVELVFT